MSFYQRCVCGGNKKKQKDLHYCYVAGTLLQSNVSAIAPSSLFQDSVALFKPQEVIVLILLFMLWGNFSTFRIVWFLLEYFECGGILPYFYKSNVCV